MQTASQICLLAAQIAKGGPGMVGIAGQMLNLVLADLKLNRNLQVNRVTQTLVVNSGTFGPFTLEPDFLRTYDASYPLQTPAGMTQFLTQITMEEWDAEFKGIQTANYPYEYATDLSTQAKLATATASGTGVTALTVTNQGLYASIPALAPSFGSAVLFARVGINTFNNSIGAGYALGEEVTQTGGIFTRPLKFVVTFLGGGGSIGLRSVIDPGDYSVLPPIGAATTSNGAGTGCTFQGVINCTLTSGGVTVAGTEYTPATPPNVIISGGGVIAAGAMTASVGAQQLGTGQLYIYPQSNGTINITHRYMRDQPDLVNPSTSSEIPWFAFQDYLVEATAARMMGITGDDRKKQFEDHAEAMLRPYVIMEGDEQKTTHAVRLDPRHFHVARSVKPTKAQPY